jgi:threonine aldolase
MRFLAAPWVGLLEDDAWIENARHSNQCAQLLARKLAAALGTEPAFPCEASAVFLRLPQQLVAQLNDRGWRFYKFIEPDIYRLMCAWSTTQKQIDDFVADVTKSLAAKRMADKYTA